MYRRLQFKNHMISYMPDEVTGSSTGIPADALGCASDLCFSEEIEVLAGLLWPPKSAAKSKEI